MRYQAATDRSILSWQRNRTLRTLDHRTELSRMAWDGGAETHGTEQGYMLMVHVWVVNRDLCLEQKDPECRLKVALNSTTTFAELLR